MTRRFEHSRTFPCEVAAAYDKVRTVPLPEVFARRHGPLPAVREVRGQSGEWGTDVGQTRTIVTADRGTVLETMTELDAPHAFAYRLTDVTGPMKTLVRSLRGRWSFEPAGTGVRVTWTWDVEPASALAAPLLPLLEHFWNGYCAKAFAQLEDLLVS